MQLWAAESASGPNGPPVAGVVTRKLVTNAQGLEKTLRVLKREGRLAAVDEALIALARGLAHAVDAEPRNAALWREYRAAVSSLKEAGSTLDPDDDTKEFLVSIRTPLRTPVGDPEES